MSNAPTASVMSTRMLLWVVFIANVIAIGIGLSLLERTERILQTEKASTQSQDLFHIYRLLADTNERVTNIQSQVLSGPIPAQIKDIESRVNAIQSKVESWHDSQPAGRP